jgi:hypothetical protein
MTFTAFFFFCGTRVWTQGRMLVRQMQGPQSHNTQPFMLFSYFSNRVLCFCSGPAWDLHPNYLHSSTPGITGVPHHAHFFEMGVLLTFFLGWPWMSILPIYASLVAGRLYPVLSSHILTKQTFMLKGCGGKALSVASCQQVLLWFGFKMPPTDSYVEELAFSAARFRGGALGKWEDHKGSDLINYDAFIFW